MKLEQLRYVCAIYEAGSINRAADRLSVSQPNISNAIGKLERELGYTLMRRSHSGVDFTDKGLELVRYASTILDKCNTIKQLRDQPAVRHFRVITPHYPPVDHAFIRLCGELERANDLQDFDLRLKGMYWLESLTELYKKSAELAVTCIPMDTVNSAYFRQNLEKHGVKYYPLAKTSVVAKLSKNHPLLAQEPFPFERLADYPMTEYSSGIDSLSAYGNIKLPFTVKPSCISVDSGRTRTELIANTNAWGIATKLPKKHEEEYGIRYVEFPDSDWSVGYLRDPKLPSSKVEDRFLTLLREELEFLND